MERGELPKDLAEEIRSRFFSDDFMKIVQTLRRNGKSFKISIRPVEIGGEKKYQAEMTDDGHVQVKNFDTNAVAEGLEEIISQRGVRDLHLMTATGDLHVRVTRKGKVTATRSAELKREVVLRPHDRVKKLPLTSFDSSSLLRAIDLADGEGRIRASMRGKYDQVNEFLKEIADVLSNHKEKDSFTVVDCGCGKAYLTIALAQYLKYSLGFKKVTVIGIDKREDVILSARKTVARLDVVEDVRFAVADLFEFKKLSEVEGLSDLKDVRPDMVISLHACDTATDEALAKGIEWKCRYIISAPCCQHELQKEIKANTRADFAGVLRYGILRERLCDILTDAFRAMIMRILGFKTQVVEFVSQDATARNIMLKCEYGVKPGQGGTVSEYLNLRDSWNVTPWLATRMEGLLSKYLERYE
jgi:SAM-dependent methyltransferase